jgi:hypothetical protein
MTINKYKVHYWCKNNEFPKVNKQNEYLEKNIKIINSKQIFLLNYLFFFFFFNELIEINKMIVLGLISLFYIKNFLILFYYKIWVPHFMIKN